MKAVDLLIQIFLAILLSQCACQWPTQVTTDKGVIQGFNAGNVNYFLGIPYATPPVSDLRWKSPQPIASWTGVKQTVTSGSPCVQNPAVIKSYTFPPNVTFSEDCLYLNVYAPNTPNPSKAVMVWIHGGGLMSGGNSEYRLLGSHMASIGDVIVVVINYRLGVFGWLAHPAFVKDDPGYPSVGNYGFLDQQQALKWVQANIAAFGGNPNNVTIMGESAGASSVCWHIIAPSSAGLFSKAVVESSSCFDEAVYPMNTTNYAVTLQKALNCEGTNDQIIKCLRAVPASTLEKLQEQSNYARLSVDGYLFVEHPYVSVINGRFTNVPLLIGNTKNEGTLFVGSITRPTTQQAYTTYLNNRFSIFAPKIAQAYPCEKFNASDCWYALTSILGDGLLICPTKILADANLIQGNTYSYVWSHTPYYELITNPDNGAFHSSEIAFVFSTLGDLYPYTPPELDLQRYITQFWTNFGNTANPNPPNTLLWGIYQAPNFQRALLDYVVSSSNRYKFQECSFWESLYQIIYPK